MRTVDLIVATYNGHDLLRVCLEELQAQSFQDFELTIIDDGSHPPVSPIVRAAFPAARILRSERNRGLVAGLSAGINAGSAPYVVLLNDDTEPDPDWLGELVACAERHPEAGSIASKLRLASERARLHSAGDTYSVRAMPGNRGVWFDDLGQYDFEAETFGACGGAALYRRSALNAVRLPNGDLFDQRLFMYCEDVDMAWRLQLLGWRCIFAPRAVVYHHLSATGGGALASYYVSRNLWLVYARSVPRQLLRPYRRRIVAYHAGRVWRALRQAREPAARASLRGTCRGLVAAAVATAVSASHSEQELARIAGLLERVELPG